MASYSQPGSGYQVCHDRFFNKNIYWENQSLNPSIGKVILSGRQKLDKQRTSSIKYITGLSWGCSTIYYRLANILHMGGYDTGVGWHATSSREKWWLITWLLLAVHRASRWGSMNLFGVAEADNTMTKTGSHGTDWDSSRRRTRYQTLHPWDRLHQHLAKSTSQVSTWKYSQDSSDKRYNQWMHECVMNKEWCSYNNGKICRTW